VAEHPAHAEDLKAIARDIFAHALADCNIDRAFDRNFQVSGTQLNLNGVDIVELDRLKRLRIVSVGKAGAAMLTSLLSRLSLPSACDVQGVLIAPSPPSNLPSAMQFFPGGHPLPNQASFTGGSAALSMLRALQPTPGDDSLCIFLISGGASAMMELPLDPTISLADTIAFHQALVHCGASIVEINCVRKHFSAVKGGRLALAAGNAPHISLFVSDVPPAHLDALASGPTIADPTTLIECREIIARYNLQERFPPSVRNFFASPALAETPKPGELTSRSWKLLDSDELAHAAKNYASSLGFHTIIDNTCDDWTFTDAANYLLNRLRESRRDHTRTCLISTGEISVLVPAHTNSAAGGRNQHFALYLANQLLPTDAAIAILSAGSDGIDGNSIAAGAVIDADTLAGSEKAAQQALAAFDSYPLLNALGAAIVNGPTGHNLRDLRILLAT
jgi:glycerate 2-kinase